MFYHEKYFIPLSTVIIHLVRNWGADRFALGQVGQLVWNTLCIVFFVSYVVRTDLPLRSLPVVGRFFR